MIHFGLSCAQRKLCRHAFGRRYSKSENVVVASRKDRMGRTLKSTERRCEEGRDYHVGAVAASARGYTLTPHGTRSQAVTAIVFSDVGGLII